MKRIVITCGALLLSYTLWAASYTYKCPKCGVVMTYDRPGVVKCPKDGSLMSPKW